MSTISKLRSGALAGMGGALVMHAFRLSWESFGNQKPRQGIFGFDHEADVNSARLVAAILFGRNLSDSDAEKIGMALHYAYGAAIGASYAVLTARFPKIRSAFGTVFGGFLWLAADEIPVSLSGVSNPFEKTTASHAGALAAHLLFGSTVEGLTRD